MVLYGGLRPISVAALLTLVFILPLLAYRSYHARLGKALVPATVALTSWSVVIWLSAVVILVYSVINFPKEGPFEEELVLTMGPKNEQDAWTRLTEATNAPDGTYSQEELINIMLQAPISMPEGGMTGTSEFPQFASITSIGQSGTEQVKKLLDEGRVDEAYQSYLEHRTIAHNLIGAEGPITLIQFLIGVGVGVQLASFYLDGENSASLPADETLLEIVERFDGRLSGGFRRAMALEYSLAKEIADDPNAACRDGSLDLKYAGVCSLHLPWPFYDRHKTLRGFHDYYLDMTMGRPVEPAQLTFWRNPVGSEVQRMILPQLAPFAGKGESIRPELAILAYVARAQQSGNFDGNPVNPLTGVPFPVTDLGDRVEIAGRQDRRMR